MQFKRNKPTKEDKLRLPGRNNVETLLLCIDGRLPGPVEVLLVGRASYEVDNPELAKNLQRTLGEATRLDTIRNIPILTEDVDAYATDETEAITAIAHKGSFVAELCDTYFHPLGEETLFLPTGWAQRVEPLKLDGMENLKPFRLHPLDFTLCKAAAGRDKDRIFLSAFLAEKQISKRMVQEHWEKTCAAHKKVKESPMIVLNVRRSLGYSPSRRAVEEMEI